MNQYFNRHVFKQECLDELFEYFEELSNEPKEAHLKAYIIYSSIVCDKQLSLSHLLGHLKRAWPEKLNEPNLITFFNKLLPESFKVSKIRREYIDGNVSEYLILEFLNEISDEWPDVEQLIKCLKNWRRIYNKTVNSNLHETDHGIPSQHMKASNQRKEVLEYLNQQKYSINKEIVESYRISLKAKSVDKLTRKEIRKMQKIAQQIAGKKETVSFEYFCDFRGRIYSNGYFYNPQGTKWHKSCLNLESK